VHARARGQRAHLAAHGLDDGSRTRIAIFHDRARQCVESITEPELLLQS
jgi:hypothetical protein